MDICPFCKGNELTDSTINILAWKCKDCDETFEDTELITVVRKK